MQLSNFLRTVLKLDAASCLAMAAIVIPMAGMLQEPLGIEAAALGAAAASLIPIGLFVLWLGTRREAPAALVAIVILGNIGWAVASFAAAGSLPAITFLGQAVVAGQGLAVLALAIAEWAGLKSSIAEARWEGA
ncbi:MAG TPA: hypothetical protein VFR52_03605 [Sphingomicrobium sp.]|nr:hypothetical protein [Sphingomicrobium sp.]